MSAEAKAIWRRVAPELRASGRLDQASLDVLGLYCDLLVQAERARALLKPGLLVRGRSEKLVTNPAWRIYRDAAALARTYAALLGLA